MPSYRDLLNYCRHTGWEELDGGGSDHYRFRKMLPDGTILRTKVSRSLSKEIPAHQFAEILKNQLHITKDEFNRHKWRW